MARTVDADRLAAARQIMSMLRRSPSFRSAVPEHDSGDRPILIASIDDPLEEVIQRVHAIGLPLMLFVPGGSASMTVMIVNTDSPEQGSLWEQAPPDATIGLLVSHFWTQRAAAFRVPDPAANRDLFVQLA
jgi:hypothetical protein